MSAGAAELGERLLALEHQVAAVRVELARARHDGARAVGSSDALGCVVEGLGEVLLAGEIDEVAAAASVTPVPESPPWVPGLLDLRGVLVPVIDLAARFSNLRRPVLPGDRFVLAQVGGRSFALVVQETHGMQRLSLDRLDPIPPDLPFARYLLGALPGAGPRVLVIAVAALIALSALPEQRP